MIYIISTSTKYPISAKLSFFPSMAALSIGHSLHSKNSASLKQLNNSARILPSCQIRKPINPSSFKKVKEKKGDKLFLSRIVVVVEKLGKGLKDNLSPKQKGDWKDLMLMGLSFAVYVYMSQKIVCAYCAWMSMLKQS